MERDGREFSTIEIESWHQLAANTIRTRRCLRSDRSLMDKFGAAQRRKLRDDWEDQTHSVTHSLTHSLTLSLSLSLSLALYIYRKSRTSVVLFEEV